MFTKNQISTAIFFFAFLIGSLSSIYILNFDGIYSIQEVLKFSIGVPYTDWFPFVGFLQPLIMHLSWSIFDNLSFNIIFYSGIFCSLYSYIFFKLTHQITININYAYASSLISIFWFSTNFGISFYQDYLSYSFFLIAIIINNLEINHFKKFSLVSIALLLCFLTKNSIGIICNFLFLSFLIIYFKFNWSKYFKFLLVYFFISSFVLILIFFSKINFENFIIYNFKILFNEFLWRFDLDNTNNTNLYEIFSSIIKLLLFPYKINIFQLFFDPGFGRLLFIPFILLNYFFYFYIFKIFFKIPKNNLSKKDFCFLIIFFSSFAIQNIAGRGFSHVLFGSTILIFFIFKFNLRNLYILTISLVLLNLPYKLNDIFENKYIYSPISPNNIYPIKFSSIKSSGIDSKEFLSPLRFLEINDIKETYAFDYNSKILNFLNSSGGLEYNSYYFVNPLNIFNNSYDCKVLQNCASYQLNFISSRKPVYLSLTDIDFLENNYNKIYNYILDNYNLIYKDDFFKIYEIKKI